MPDCQETSIENCPHVHASAKIAVKEVFAILGVDIDKPESVEEFREDLRFGRRLRMATDKGFFSLATAAAVAMGLLIWEGFKRVAHAAT